MGCVGRGRAAWGRWSTVGRSEEGGGAEWGEDEARRVEAEFASGGVMALWAALCIMALWPFWMVLRYGVMALWRLRWLEADTAFGVMAL